MTERPSDQAVHPVRRRTENGGVCQIHADRCASTPGGPHVKRGLWIGPPKCQTHHDVAGPQGDGAGPAAGWMGLDLGWTWPGHTLEPQKKSPAVASGARSLSCPLSRRNNSVGTDPSSALGDSRERLDSSSPAPVLGRHIRAGNNMGCMGSPRSRRRHRARPPQARSRRRCQHRPHARVSA